MIGVLKAMHLLGVVLFFGSILGHVALGFLPEAGSDPQKALFVRQAIEMATEALTLPGLALLLLTGAAMGLRGRLRVLRFRWMTLHAAIGLLILTNAVLVLAPLGRELVVVASYGAGGAWPPETFTALEGREAVFGAVNVVLCFVALFIAVLKPRFGQTANRSD